MAKGKILKTTISLAGRVDGSLLKALNSSKSNAANAAKAIGKSTAASMNAANKAVVKSFHSMASGAVKLYAAVKAIGSLKEYASETITAAKAQLEVQTKLSSVLENVKSIQIRGPNAAAEAAKELNKVADQLEGIGIIGNDITVAGMQQLATYQLSDNEISVLASGMDDLLAQTKGFNATQGDAVSIANMIGKAMNGSVGALSKVGISFTEAQAKAIKTGDATLRAATIAEVLKENVGGVNEAMAQTDQGQIFQAQNTFDAIKEEIGYFLLPLLNKLIKGVLPYAQKALEKLTTVLNKLGPVISDKIGQGFDLLSKVLPNIADAIAVVLPLFGGLLSPLSMGSDLLPVLMGALQSILPYFISLSKAIVPLIPQLIKQLIPAMQSLLPAFMGIIKQALPVLISLINKLAPVVMEIVGEIAPLIPLLVGALMPAIQMLFPPIMSLINNLLPVLRTLFGAVYSMINKLAPVISVVAQLFASVLSAAIITLTPIIQGIINHFTGIINILSGVIDFVVNAFTGNWTAAWNNIRDVFSGIFTSFADIAKAPLNAIIGLINSSINGINGLTGVINKIPGVEISEIPQIPYLAKGATVSSPTLAMIGEGKVPETVVPHNNTPRSRALLQDAAKGVGVPLAGKMSGTPAVNKILNALSYFADRFPAITRKPKPSGNEPDGIGNHGGNTYQFYFSPTVYANDKKGVREVLDDEFEKFKRYVKQLRDEEGREVFG